MEVDYRKQQRQTRLREICSKYVYPWLKEVGVKFKAFGAYPLCLSDYYTDSMDKQVAEVVSLMAPLIARDKYIMDLHRVLGTSPWNMVRKRDFLELLNDKTLSNSPSFNNRLLFNLLDWVWEVSCQDKVPLEYVILGELDIIKKHHKRSITEVLDSPDLKFKMENVLVKMSLRDGYGVGLWDFLPEDELPYPLDKEMLSVLKAFYPIPNGTKKDEIPEALSFIGFDKKVDFLYAAWGYQFLRRHEPVATYKFEKKLKMWYNSLYIKYDLFADVPTTCIE